MQRALQHAIYLKNVILSSLFIKRRCGANDVFTCGPTRAAGCCCWNLAAAILRDTAAPPPRGVPACSLLLQQTHRTHTCTSPTATATATFDAASSSSTPEQQLLHRAVGERGHKTQATTEQKKRHDSWKRVTMKGIVVVATSSSRRRDARRAAVFWSVGPNLVGSKGLLINFGTAFV